MPLPEDQNGIVIGYVINIDGVESEEMLQFFSTANNLTVISLTPFTTYLCMVAANTSVGRGPFSTTVSVRTSEEGLLLFEHMLANIKCSLC